ncbi:hypothetical protein [uncultured Xylophilus sp.]|uniref:hypothetical protein n=1 Tax=uncultured Xylophilus sp. TaxID=296832 RepID=UPI0025E17088|nr:hypothetical protein [uncultured Xylophilus sp.]
MTSPSPVRRRHVFYLSGFDPNGPPRYHRLYRDGAERQAACTGAAIAVGPRTRDGADAVTWDVRYRPPGAADDHAPVATTYRFPRWDDIVRAHWWRGLGPQLADLLATTWQYLRTGALWKTYRQRPVMATIVFMPVVLLALFFPGLALGLWATVALIEAWQSDTPLAAPVAGVTATGALALLWLRSARRSWHAQWILRSYGFIGRMEREGVPALDPVLDRIAADLCRQVRDGGDDEVLVVGHSLGSVLAVSVLARALRQDPDLARRGTALGLLTLGHCTPSLSNLPSARRFRDELATLAQASDLCWVDFSDPLDAYGFAGVDPFAAAGVAAPRPGHPQMRSPGFGQLFSAGRWRRPRIGRHDLHAQYLCASAPGHAYDYFAITAGPKTLADRMARGPQAG